MTLKKVIQQSRSEEFKKWSVVHYMSPNSDRWRERSRTYTGIAEALATQYGIF